MRIISGKWKGRRLSSAVGRSGDFSLRPTMDRVRESIFNILAHGGIMKSSGSRVLDLFSGTGALGFEALSRGASYVCFVDSNKRSLKILNENVSLLGVADNIRIIKRDAKKLGINYDHKYDLIFLDPPYGKSFGECALESAVNGGWISDKALVIWEENVEILPPKGFTFLEKRLIGSIHLNFLRFG